MRRAWRRQDSRRGISPVYYSSTPWRGDALPYLRNFGPADARRWRNCLSLSSDYFLLKHPETSVKRAVVRCIEYAHICFPDSVPVGIWPMNGSIRLLRYMHGYWQCHWLWFPDKWKVLLYSSQVPVVLYLFARVGELSAFLWQWEWELPRNRSLLLLPEHDWCAAPSPGWWYKGRRGE